MYILKSKVREKIAQSGLRVNKSVYSKLDAEVEKIINNIISVTKLDHRKTVTAEHFNLSEALRLQSRRSK